MGIAFAVNRAAQLVAKDPLKAAQGHYTLEIQTDSPFAPQGERSQSGIVLMWAGGVIGFHSSRQPFITTSTAESELLAMQEGHLLATSLVLLVQGLAGAPKYIVIADNIAALTLVLQSSGTWRTRHLRLRAAHAHERIERELVSAGVSQAQNFLQTPSRGEQEV